MPIARPSSKLAAAALISALTVVPMSAGIALTTLPAKAQTVNDPPPPPGSHDPHAMGPHHPGPDKMDAAGPHGPWMRQAMDHQGRRDHWRGDAQHRQMRLARKLAAVEVAIGIRSDQLDAWRDFTSKLVSFVGSPRWRGGSHQAMGAMGGTMPDQSTAGASTPPASGTQAGQPQPPVNAGNAEGDATPQPTPPKPPANATNARDFGILDRIVERAMRRGDEARALKDSMDKLKSVLTPDQIREARMLMRPGGGHHGWRGGDWQQGWGHGDMGGTGPAEKAPAPKHG